MLPNIKIQHQTKVIKSLRYWHRDRDTSDLEQDGPHGATHPREPGAGLRAPQDKHGVLNSSVVGVSTWFFVFISKMPPVKTVINPI